MQLHPNFVIGKSGERSNVDLASGLGVASSSSVEWLCKPCSAHFSMIGGATLMHGMQELPLCISTPQQHPIQLC